jgi:hypothetical protein
MLKACGARADDELGIGDDRIRKGEGTACDELRAVGNGQHTCAGTEGGSGAWSLARRPCQEMYKR